VLRDALEKLRLNTAAEFQPEHSRAGIRVPLRIPGLLHMDIVQDRLEREFNIDLIPRAQRALQMVTRAANCSSDNRPSSPPRGDRAIREPSSRPRDHAREYWARS